MKKTCSKSAMKLAEYIKEYALKYGKLNEDGKLEAKCPVIMAAIITQLTSHNIYSFEWDITGEFTSDFYYPSKAKPEVALIMNDDDFKNSDFRIFEKDANLTDENCGVVKFITAFEYLMAAVAQDMDVAEILEESDD